MTNKNPYDEPVSRPLKVYAFDPSRGKTLGNHMTVNVPYEKLTDGLAGNYLNVIDYDASNKCYYEPVDLNHPYVLISSGLDPSEADPRFHQQMVYAVASKTIEIFEFALGRKIKWAFNRSRKEKLPLRIFPHAMQEANAFYSRDLKALVFGYFPASDADPVSNLPGQTIFTCLSHDVIAHETTHALIDGQRRYFMIPSSPDTLAFHEAFADIVALFQHFTFQEVLLDTILRTGGLIYKSQIVPDISRPGEAPTIVAELATANPLVQLAKQFGEAIGKRAALRSAIGTSPDPTVLSRTFEPHDRGAILVAAVFDAFFTVYVRRVEDLLRINKAINPSQVQADIANRLAGEASKIAENFLNICIRAIDYCPPVDIRFGDFLRAIITADYDLVREDPIGYRAALIDAFRFRGIQPSNVISYAEESLRWLPAVDAVGNALCCPELEFDLFKPVSSDQQSKNAIAIYKFVDTHRAELGLDATDTLAVSSFHPLHRVGPNRQLKMEGMLEVVQTKTVLIDPDDPNSGSMTFYGGVTLIIDLSREHQGAIRYAIRKTLGTDNDSNKRLNEQRAFFGNPTLTLGLNPYAAPDEDGKQLDEKHFDFSFTHRGY